MSAKAKTQLHKIPIFLPMKTRKRIARFARHNFSVTSHIAERSPAGSTRTRVKARMDQITVTILRHKFLGSIYSKARIDVMPSPWSSAPNLAETNVAQAIVESLTRCFHPIRGNPCPEPGRGVPANAAVPAAGGDRNKPIPRTPPQKKTQKQYDADRYIHRKLEIFRTTDEECIAAFGISRPRPSPSSARNARRPSMQTNNGQSRSRGERNSNSNTLVSSSDEEISNLANNQRRLSEEERENRGKCYNLDNSGNFVASILRMLQDPLSCITNVDKHYNYSGGGLCFANPVRMAETENVSNLSDWRLTAKEFVARYQDVRAAADDIPDVVASSASEEATMTSASYFDQKYSHVIEKNPPVPLFHEHRVAVSEFDTEGVLKIVERRRGEGSAKGKHSVTKTTPTQVGGGRGKNRMSSLDESLQGSKSSRNPVHLIRVKKSSKQVSGSENHAQSNNYDTVPIGKSSSVSSQSADEEMTLSPPSSPSIWQRARPNRETHQHNHQPQARYREPDLVCSHDTSISQ